MGTMFEKLTKLKNELKI